MRKFCPRIKEECKQDACMYWFEAGKNCLPIFTELHNANWWINSDTEKDIGLEKINADISKTLTGNFIKDIMSDNVTSDSDKQLLKKLWGEKLEKEKLLEIKNSYKG